MSSRVSPMTPIVVATAAKPTTIVTASTEKKGSKAGIYALIIFLGILVILAVLALAGVFKPNKCKNVTCENEGECDKDTGKCKCVPGYEGEKCADKYCKNGGTFTPASGGQSQSCKCAENFTGKQCESKKYPDDWLGCYVAPGVNIPSGFEMLGGGIEHAPGYTWFQLKQMIKTLPQWKPEYKYVAITSPNDPNPNNTIWIWGSVSFEPTNPAAANVIKIPNANDIAPLQDSAVAGCKSDSVEPVQCTIPAPDYPGTTYTIYKM